MTGRFARRFAVVLALLGAARLALPFVLQRYVERVVERSGNYVLDLDAIDIGLWRGAYQLDGMRLSERTEAGSRPLLEAGRVDLSVQWRWLLRGALVGEVVLHRPQLFRSFRANEPKVRRGPQDEEPAAEWWSILDDLFPFRVDRLVVRDGEIRYRTEELEPPVDLYMTDVYAELLNLTNIREENGVLLAQLEVAGRPFGTGEAELRALFDPNSERTRLELRAELRKISLPDMNDALQALADIDVERGELSMYTEMEVSGDRLEGYAKLLVEDLQVLRWKEIRGPRDALEALWEGLVSLAGEVLENQPHDRLATLVPLDGQLGDVGTDTPVLIATLLRNAFIRALAPALEGTVDIEDVGVEPEIGGAGS